MSSRLRSSLACEACRIRKYKCSKDRPACTACIKQDRVCKYVPMPAKTPLTRQYVTYLEERIRRLEAGMNVRPSSSGANVAEPPETFDPDSETSSHFMPRQPDVTQSPLLGSTSANEGSQDLPPELLPQSSDGFDWAEEEFSVDEISDGMAALSVRPEGAGYLGASSSVAFLRALLPLGWDLDIPHPVASNDVESPRFSQPAALPSPHQVLDAATPRYLMRTLIDAYFLYYHTSYPFVHEATFRAQFNEQIPQPKGHAWPMLLNTILALGAWCVGDENSNLDDSFYQVAIRYSENISVFESGSLTLVQALLLLSNYAQKRNKPNTGWNLLGLAVRIALSLGLHREFPNWSISLLQREIRRRIWWGLFIFDSGASVTFGRPILLPNASLIDVKMVLNIQEESLTPATAIEPAEIAQPTIYSSLIAQSKFHSTSNEIHNRLVSTSQPSAEQTLDMIKPINEWFVLLPDFYRDDVMAIPNNDWHAFARYRLLSRYWNHLIILHRPFLLRWASARLTTQVYAQESTAENQCRNLCMESAHATITSTNEYIANHSNTRLSSWYSLYFLFQASLIPTICLCTDPHSPEAPLWSLDIQTSKTLLLQAFSTNPLAARCLKVIDRLVNPTQSSMAADGSAAPWDMMAEPDRFFDEIYSLSSFSSLTGTGIGTNERDISSQGSPRWDMLNEDFH